VIQELVPVAEMGTFSIIQDPTGAVFGLWETKGEGS
jgi:predicted enzyme related to lactoylglutathione lyase